MDTTALMGALDLGSKALAVLVSLVGIFIAVDQLTVGSRLRKREAWARGALEHEKDPHRKRALEAIMVEATARIVGGIRVPARYFLEVMLWLVLAPVNLYIASARDPSVSGMFWAAVVNLVLLWVPFRRGIRVLAERYRITHAFESGKKPVPAPELGLLALNEGGTRTEFLLAALLSLGVTAAIAAVIVGFLTFPSIALGLALASVVITIWTGYAIHRYCVMLAARRYDAAILPHKR